MRMFLLGLAAVATAAVCGCATRADAPHGEREDVARAERSLVMPSPSDMPTGFIDKAVTVNGALRRYSVYVPYEYDPSQHWPMIVFLHGIGERGDDGVKQTAVGIGQAIRFNPERFPCLVVMPQCPESGFWRSAFDDVRQAIEKTREEYSVDTDRIYLTGLSMGGYGTWVLGAEDADTFAALMPICGGGRVQDAPKLATLPIWAFHGGADETVKPEESRKMVEAVKNAGGNVQYTEYKGVGHNSWDNAYGDKKAIAWLLYQRK